MGTQECDPGKEFYWAGMCGNNANIDAAFRALGATTIGDVASIPEHVLEACGLQPEMSIIKNFVRAKLGPEQYAVPIRDPHSHLRVVYTSEKAA